LFGIPDEFDGGETDKHAQTPERRAQEAARARHRGLDVTARPFDAHARQRIEGNDVLRN
jgi:hypothetical protein